MNIIMDNILNLSSKGFNLSNRKKSGFNIGVDLFGFNKLTRTIQGIIFLIFILIVVGIILAVVFSNKESMTNTPKENKKSKFVLFN